MSSLPHPCSVLLAIALALCCSCRAAEASLPPNDSFQDFPGAGPLYNEQTYALALSDRHTLCTFCGEQARDVRFHTAAYWRLAAGNPQTYFAAGLAIVIGKDLPPASPGIGNRIRSGAKLQGSVEARLTADDSYEDGHLFQDDPGLKRRNFVRGLVYGTRFDFPGTRTDSHGPWFLQFKVGRRAPGFRSSLPLPRHRVAALTIGTEF